MIRIRTCTHTNGKMALGYIIAEIPKHAKDVHKLTHVHHTTINKVMFPFVCCCVVYM